MTITLHDLVYAYCALVCTLLIYALGGSLRLKIQLKNGTITNKEYAQRRVLLSMIAWSWWTLLGVVTLLLYLWLR